MTLFLVAAPLRADTLDDIKQRGTLVWGADQEGGGPFVYPDPADPNQLVGFEVDLANLLAAELGVKAQFKQCDWATLPEFLRAKSIDVVLNGYEFTPSRAARMKASRPYYIYQLQLLARDDDDSVKSWGDLRAVPNGRRKQVSVLTDCAAAIYLKQNWAGDVDIFEYQGNTDSMAKVRDGSHDATLQDYPIAAFFRTLPQGRGLRFVGEPVGSGYYVMYVRPEDTRLIEALNAAVEKLIRDGRLRGIYEKYGIWTPEQEKLASVTTPEQTAVAAKGWRAVSLYGPTLMRAAGMTLLLSFASMPLAIALGLLIALGRLYGPRMVQWPLAIYVEVLRGTPVMLQLYVIYFVLPDLLHIPIDPRLAAIAGLAINYSAYEAEIYRAGLQAIPRGQMEAALALGMTRGAALRRVIVPQAVRIVVPAVTNDFIALFKDTSICSVLSVIELTKSYNMLANSTGSILELAAMTGILYMAMSYPLSVIAARLEKRMSGGMRV